MSPKRQGQSYHMYMRWYIVTYPSNGFTCCIAVAYLYWEICTEYGGNVNQLDTGAA